MHLHTHYYQNPETLKSFVLSNGLTSETGLIQIFSGNQDIHYVGDLLNQLVYLLPDFRIIGASTSGEISPSGISDGEILLAISCFEHTRCEVIRLTSITQEAGITLGRRLNRPDARLLIAFGNTLNNNPDPFLQGIAEEAPELCIAGGNAGDNSRYHATFVISGDEICSQGIVCAVLYSDRLHVNNHSLMSWTPIGMEMTVTRCNGNILYELDNKPVMECYRYYLGDEIVQDIPNSITAFPLLIETPEVTIARAPVGLTTDGGMKYAGNISAGQKVRFGISDISTMIDKVNELSSRITHHEPVEAMFIYSCTARRNFLQKTIIEELKSLTSCGPCAGFFTYGEYFHVHGENRLLNITTTLITLSESDEIRTTDNTCLARSVPPSVLRALTHLTNTTANELRQSLKLSEQYKFALDETAVVSKADINGNITYINPLYENLTGYTAEELKGQSHLALYRPHTPEPVIHDLWSTLKQKKMWKGTLRSSCRPEPGYFDINFTGMPILNASGEVTEYIGLGDDITQLLEQQQLITEQRTDKLTGLPSRAKLLEDLKQSSAATLALGDIKSFKAINDYYGIATGDLLIREVATRLSHYLLEQNIHCYRLYGAEFAFLPPRNMSVDGLRHALCSSAEYLEQHPISFDDDPIDIELSFGIAQGKDHLMALAEAALQQSKKEQSAEIIPLLTEETHDHLSNLSWVKAVKSALNEQRMSCYFQPIASAHDRSVQHYEALIRLQQTDGSIVSPGEFLNIVKRTRYYPQITRLVIRQAIAASQACGCNISLNLSAEDIASPDTRRFIREQLEKYGGSRIIFEITESESLEDYAQVRAFIKMIRDYQSAIAIDDFGSGYSNFAHLVELQPDYIKIDGSIISGILSENKKRLITESIIELGHKIGAEVIAEFVSADDITHLLTELGVDYLQGYAIGRPGPL